MILCGLDIATTTGAAVMDGDALVHAEAFRPRGTIDAEIFHGFRVWFRAFLLAHHVEHAAIEMPLPTEITFKKKDGSTAPGSNMKTFYRLYGMHAHGVEICHALNIPCEPVHQATWRKAFLGNVPRGADRKALALNQCKLLKFDVARHDAAEAVGVCWWLGGHLGVARRMRPGELFSGEKS